MTLSSPLRTFTSLPPPPPLCCSEFQVWPHRGATGHVPAQLNTGAAGRGGGGLYTTPPPPQFAHNKSTTAHLTQHTQQHCLFTVQPSYPPSLAVRLCCFLTSVERRIFVLLLHPSSCLSRPPQRVETVAGGENRGRQRERE